ncbi:hypothetical protein [Sphingomonas sp. OTU376]|uniref:hypothetical protein n=1 Tax=Sphingomonas sp. OTU376 TaxID=3043863 RepID=UPI00313D59C8
MKIRQSLFHASLAITIAAFAGQPAHAQTATPGFGTDKRAPKGTPFTLPAGIELAGPLFPADDDGNCPRARTATVGSGLMVRRCVPVRNRTGAPVTVIFPAGLVIVSASEGFQNGLLVEQQVLRIPPTTNGGPGRLLDEKGKPTDIVNIPLHVYCLNKDREIPEGGGQYAFGPVSQHAGLAELYAFTADKDFKGDGQRVEVLQEVVWEVIRTGRFTAKDRADLLRGYVADA